MNLDELIKQITQEVLAKASAGNVDTPQGLAPQDIAKYIDHTLLK